MSDDRPPTKPLLAIIYLALGFGLSILIVVLLGIELNFQHVLPLALTSIGTVLFGYSFMEFHSWISTRSKGSDESFD